jgi:tetratricopeptide (TPR) repeat protein
LWYVAYIADEIGSKVEARKNYEQCLAVRKQLVSAHPEDLGSQRDLANTYNQLGRVYSTEGRPKEAWHCHEQARVLREKLAANKAAKAQDHENLALTYTNLGGLHNEKGEWEAARSFYLKARDIYRQLAADHHATDRFKYSLAGAYNNLGVLHRNRREWEVARGFFVEALRIRQQLAGANLTAGQLQDGLALTLYHLGHLYHLQNQPAMARRYYEEAIAIHEQVVRANPAVTRYQRHLARTYNHLGYLLRLEAGQQEAAWQSLLHAYDILERLIRANPSASDLLRDQIDVFTNLGTHQYRIGATTTALCFHAKAHALAEQLVGIDAQNTDYRSVLGDTYINMAGDLQNLGRHEEALTCCQGAIEHQSWAFHKDPRSARYRGKLSRHYIVLATVRQKLNRPAEAVAAALEARKLRPQEPTHLYNVARTLALCVPPAGHDQALPGAKEQPERQQYVDLVLETLRQAVAAGWRNGKRLRTDQEFRPLQESAAFRQLLKELDAKSSQNASSAER